MRAPALPPVLPRFPLAGLAIPPLVGLTLWMSNVTRVPYEDALPVVAALLAAALLLLAGLRLIVRDWVRAGLIGGIAAAYIFYLGPGVAALASVPWLRGLLMALAGLFALDLARRVPRDRAALLGINGRINLVLLPVVLLGSGIAAARQVTLERQRPEPSLSFPAFAGHAAAGSPDVWHIILDRYASSATLRTVYAYDNKPFLDALRARGFAVREAAFSNYQRTGHSVASTLNGAYLDPLAGRMSGNQDDWVPLYRALTDNAATRFFEGQGYETVFAGSWWNPIRRSRVADRNVNFRAIPELGRLLLDRSVLGDAMAALNLPYGDGRADQCLRARAKFRELRKLAREPARKYVLAHFLVPHPPFVLNADGSCRSLAEAERASRRDNYVSQVRYANDEVVRLVDAILAGPRPAIVLLHGDEGPWPAAFAGDERFLGADTKPVDWTKASNAEILEKLGILMAVRSPDGSARDLPATPVNLYPRLLRNHFGGRRPDWPDRHLLFKHRTALYSFKDVTPLIREAGASESD
jgi:Sulfatase